MTRLLFTVLLLSSMAGLADAQTARYPPDRVFSYYDRDKNGKLDGGEYERFSSELKEACHESSPFENETRQSPL